MEGDSFRKTTKMIKRKGLHLRFPSSIPWIHYCTMLH